METALYWSLHTTSKGRSFLVPSQLLLYPGVTAGIRLTDFSKESQKPEVLFGFYYFHLFRFVVTQADPMLASIFPPWPPKHWDSRHVPPLCPAVSSFLYGSLYVVYNRPTFVPVAECGLTALGGESSLKK